MSYKSECRKIVRKMVRYAKANDMLISIVDPWESRLNNYSQKESDIVESAFAMDEVRIDFHTTNNKYLGFVFIVHEFDGDSEELIADYSANDITESIVENATTKQEQGFKS
tara:strand:- start:47 stop:379 length:333 start_codon:yes stop_codon:yes gene_type:complete